MQRKTTERPHLLLELIHRAGIQSVVTGVVGPWRDLVHVELPAVRHEELHPHHADVLQRFGHSPGNRSRASRANDGATRAGTTVVSRIPSRWRFSPAWERGHLAILPSRQNHGELGLEGKTLLQHARDIPERRKAPPHPPGSRIVAWPFPSYPKRLVLSSAGSGIAAVRRPGRWAADRPKRSGEESSLPKKCLLRDSVLCDGHGRRAGGHTAVDAARRSSAAAGTFSNSVVTASHSASSPSAISSS